MDNIKQIIINATVGGVESAVHPAHPAHPSTASSHQLNVGRSEKLSDTVAVTGVSAVDYAKVIITIKYHFHIIFFNLKKISN